MMRKSKGITLIALVITIIVLLILAGISIAMLTGENGILNKAETAGEETRAASVEELKDIWKMHKQVDEYDEEKTAQTLEDLLNDLESQNLITAEEKLTIKNTGQVKIGNKTIIFGNSSPIDMAEIKLKEILEMLNIVEDYTLEDFVNNKDSILTKALENKNVVKEIVQNKNIFLNPLTNSEVAEIEISKSQNMKDEIINDLEWVTAIIEKGVDISGFDEQMQTIPKMTSNTKPEGEVIASSVYNEYFAWKAFDRDNSSSWYPTPASTEPVEPHYVAYKYNRNHNIYKIDVDYQYPTSIAIKDIDIEIYVSENEEGEDSWKFGYKHTFSIPPNSLGQAHNFTWMLDQIANVRRIKICCKYHHPTHNLWGSVNIAEIRAYGV